MTTLSRLTGKVFAGDANLTDLGVFGSAKDQNPTNPTGTNTEEQIQADTAYEKGWTEGVVTTKNFPPMEEVNGVLRTISYQACYLLQEGIPAYDANTNYSATSVVKSVNGNILTFYVSQQDDNKGNSLSDTTCWQPAVFQGASRVGDVQFTLNYGALPNKCIELMGQTVPIDEYGELHSIYLDTYNDGTEPVGEFRLPNFTGKTIYGATTVGNSPYLAAGLPSISASTNTVQNHTHSINSSGAHTHTTEKAGNHRHSSRRTSDEDDGGGRFTSGEANTDAAIYTDYAGEHSHSISSSGAHTHTTQGAGQHNHTVTFTFGANGIYGNSTTVQPPAIKVRAYTRYEL